MIAGRDDNMVYFVSISISTCSRIVTPDYILNDCYLSAMLCFAGYANSDHTTGVVCAAGKIDRA